MKKTLLFVFAVLMGIATMEAQTVVFEDGFESYDDGYNLVGAGYAVWEGTATVTDVTAEGAVGTANSGNKFGKSDISKNNFAFRKTLTLEAGKTYTWEIATKAEDGVKHTLQVNPTGTYQKVDVTNADWQTHSVQFTVQAGFEEVTLAVYRWAKKVVSFDDFKLSEATATSVTEIEDKAVQVYQSAAGEFSLTAAAAISSVKVFDISGQLVKQIRNSGATEVRFSLNELPQGLFILQIEDVEGNRTAKKVMNN